MATACNQDSTDAGRPDLMYQALKVTQDDDKTTKARSSENGEPLPRRSLSEGRSSRLLLSSDGARANESEAVFNMVNAVLGAGVLGFPYCYKVCGIALATVLVLLSYGVCQLSMRLLLYSAHLTNKRSYEELARTLFGRIGGQAVNVCIVTLNITCMVAYISILADVLSSVAGSVIPPGAEPSRNVLMAGITIFGALPVGILVKSPEVLALVSQASVGFVFFFTTVVAVLAFSPVLQAEAIVIWDWEGLLVAFPVVTYGFTAHHFLFGINSSLRQSSVKRMSVVVRRAMMVCALVYAAVGACGYASFRQLTAGDVLRNLGADGVEGLRGGYERLLKLGYGLSILGAVPLGLLPIYDSMLWTVAGLAPSPLTFAPLKDQPAPNIAPSPLQEHTLTVLVLGLSLLLAVLVPNVELVFGLAGAAPASLLAFVFPGALFLLASGQQRATLLLDVDELRASQQGGQQVIASLRRKAWLLLVFGTVMGVACTHATLMAVHQEAEVIQLAQEIVARNEQVEQAMEYESKAKKVAAAIAGVAAATEQVTAAQEHTSASLGAVEQAAAALRSMDPAAPSQAQPLLFGGPHREHTHDKKAEHESFALGAINANLKDLKRRVNTTLHALSSVTQALEGSTAKLHDAERVSEGEAQVKRVQRAKEQLRQVGAKTTPQSLESSTSREGEGQYGFGEDTTDTAASSSSAKRDGDTQTSSDDSADQDGEATRGDDGGHQALEQVLAQANDTLKAIKHTADVLEDAERAAAAVERAKGHDSAVDKMEAAKVMEMAVHVTNEAAKKVENTITALKKAQEETANELAVIVKQLASDASKSEAEDGPDVHAKDRREEYEKPAYDTTTGELIRKDRGGMAQDAADALQQLSDVGKRDPNATKAVEVQSEVAKKAVKMASTAVDSALLGVNRTVERSQKNPEVAARAGEIARQLNKLKKDLKDGETSSGSQRNGSQGAEGGGWGTTSRAGGAGGSAEEEKPDSAWLGLESSSAGAKQGSSRKPDATEGASEGEAAAQKGSSRRPDASEVVSDVAAKQGSSRRPDATELASQGDALEEIPSP